ncbi:peptide/nickel transport system permease protein [Mesorhizobium soli]|uniref:ABC transporter permease n=1 Tax=Pseudaminobacter soli (ex Li et al. 2025) TaxID=1295366 RepID=UPI00247638C2|nr:ABC transporter permease [Mesorhizobium soli]MDH6233014.1 peptide/nickel transport system permease protein [Mesorhizobium soli]
MIRFLARRIAFGAGVLLVLSAFVFFLFFVAPGDPARMIAGDKATETQLEMIRKNLGVDRPIVVQYGTFLSRALTGDLGFSYRNQQPVAQIIVRRIPATLSLVAGAALLWLAIGVPIGIMSARYPGSLRDRIGQAFILVGLSFPTFVLGMMSLYLLYFLPKQAGLTLFPPGGYKALTGNPVLWAWHLILPWSTLALTMAAVYARLTRGQMLDVMGEDYIRTARAKGLTERRVVWKHGMRAALTPLVTQLGADIALMLGGVIVIEQVYGLQGVGALAVQAVTNQDRPIIIGVVLLGGVFIVAANIVVDLFYVLLDPRVR